MSNFIQTTTTEVSNYALKVNEAFDYPNTNPVILLDACPSSSELVTVESKFSTGDSFVFDHRFSEERYMSNALKFRFDIPIEITRKADFMVTPSGGGAAVATDITEANFMTACFGPLDDLCISQYGLIQAMQTCQISLNGKTLNIPTQISECINILSQYYNAEDVAEWFPASTPDMFQSFEQYSGNSKILSFIDEDGEKAYTSISPEQDNNIFASKYTRGYMSRTPVFKYVSTGANAKRQCTVRVSFFSYLPLSFGSVPDKISSLIGVNSLAIQVTLKPSMLAHLFNTKATFYDRIESMSVNKSASSMIKGRLMFNLWGQPNGTVLPRGENGALMPYSIQFPDISMHTGNTITGVTPGAMRQFHYADIQTNTVPKSIYIAMVKLKNGSFEEHTATPINYGLINNLELNVSSLKTNYSGIAQLSYLADTNGYDAFTDTLGRLTKGFAIKLDLTKDLSIPGVTCVGASGVFRISVNGTFYNQGSTNADYQLMVITSLPSSLDFDGHNFGLSSGVLIDAGKLMTSNFMRDIQYNYGRRMEVLGAGLWSDIKKGAVKLAKNAWANRHDIAKVAGDAVGLVRTLRGGERMYSNVSGAGTQILGAGSTSTTNFFPKGAGNVSSPDIWKRK